MSASALHTEEIAPLLRREDKVVPQPCCPLHHPWHQQQHSLPSFETQPVPLRGELVFPRDLGTAGNLSLEKRQEWALFGCA